jgi:hypothetical protein
MKRKGLFNLFVLVGLVFGQSQFFSLTQAAEPEAVTNQVGIVEEQVGLALDEDGTAQGSEALESTGFITFFSEDYFEELGLLPLAGSINELSPLISDFDQVDLQLNSIHASNKESNGTCPLEMTAYWKLDETSGQIFDDFIGANNASCAVGNCPDFATGHIGGALDFNGTSDWLEVADNDSLDWASDDSFTIELWAKLGPNDCNSRNKVMIGRDNRPGGVHWWLGCAVDSKAANFNLIDTSNEGKNVEGSTQINDNEWHHIVAIRDESLNQNRIYVDGVMEDSETYDYQAGFGATTTLGIGYMAYTGIPDYYYNGLLDEVAVYQRALTDVEITQHYDAGLEGLSYCEIGDLPPTITSEPLTTGYLNISYSYDVGAIGTEPINFSLSTAPSGMTIEEDTGLISWTPSSTGEFAVTVLAQNTQGTDEQPYTIQVFEVTPCPANMSSYWKLNETSSGSYADSYGDNTGACAGVCPVPTTDGMVSTAQVFDGDTTGIDIPADDAFDWGVNDSFSIEFWMKGVAGQTCTGTANPNDNEVIVGRDDPTTNLHWWFGCENTDGEARFQLGDTTGNSAMIVGPSINNGNWHHLVGIRDAQNDLLRLYVDGKEVSGSPISKNYLAGFESATAELNLGWLDLNPGFHYKGTLDEVALYDRVLTPNEIRRHYYLSRGYCSMCDSPVDIMPLGDSITVGNASGVVPDDPDYYISYRKDLWEILGDGGYVVDFVGSQTNGEVYDPDFDYEHEGHGGWTDSQIRDSVVVFLSANPADVILLHIGTNGLDPDPAQVEQILDNIDSVDPKITVILARIINRRSYSQDTSDFNDNVEQMALDRVNNPANDAYPDKIIIVDLENGVGMDYGQAPADGDMWDNLHPYETGYEKMANGWLNGDNFGSLGLVDFLPVCGAITPSIDLVKSVTPTSIYAGETVTYTFEIHNTGTVPLSEVRLTDDQLGDIALEERVTDGIVALYDFEEGSGDVVHDVSGVGTVMDLTIQDPENVSWLPGGGLSVDASTLIASSGDGTKIIDAAKASNEISIEAWVKPANDTQGGPARIVTLSNGAYDRNFTMMQDGDNYDTRLRTTATSENGMPSLAGGSVSTTGVTQLVYTRDTSGTARFYQNGVEMSNRGDITGDFSNWATNYQFGLANEFGADRTWLGELHLVAVYDKALSAEEVEQNYNGQLLSTSLDVGESLVVKYVTTIDVDTTNLATASGVDPLGSTHQAVDTATVTVVERYDLTVAVDPTGSGTTTPGGGIHSYDEGSVVDVTATPVAGWEFDHWSGDCTGEGACQVTMDGDKNVTAHFTQIMYDLTVAVDPAGSGTTNPIEGVHSYAFGSVVDVTATVNEGYEFLYWSGACTGEGACQVRMDADKVVTAHFIFTGIIVVLPGSITIEKVTDPEDGTGFAFNGDLGDFNLDDGESKKFDELQAGDYKITEILHGNWQLDQVSCTGGDYTAESDGVVVHLDEGENIKCVFENQVESIELYLPLILKETSTTLTDSGPVGMLEQIRRWIELL